MFALKVAAENYGNAVFPKMHRRCGEQTIPETRFGGKYRRIGSHNMNIGVLSTRCHYLMSSRGGVLSFIVGAIAGAVCSAAVICFYQNTLTKRRVASGSNRSNNNNETTRSPPVVDETRMDSCELDQRMIRKAEGAILNRTSRLIVVVERCTNDHNYSAILRTVEALGVQHVYIIAPQCIQSTLTTMTINEDDKENDDVKVVELKRSSGQPVRRATESEIKDRALHHLYARKATEWLTVTGK